MTMGKQIFVRIEKVVAILLAIFFVMTLTAASVGAQPSPAFSGPAGHPNMRWDGHTMWDDQHHWRWNGHNWYDNDHNFRWDGHNWWDDKHHWRWDGQHWWNGNHWWDGHRWH